MRQVFAGPQDEITACMWLEVAALEDAKFAVASEGERAKVDAATWQAAVNQAAAKLAEIRKHGVQPLLLGEPQQRGEVLAQK